MDIAGNSRSDDVLQATVGAKLTQANLNALDNSFNEISQDANLGGRRDQGAAEALPKRDQELKQNLKKMLETGKFQTRSGYGNRFRVELNAG